MKKEVQHNQKGETDVTKMKIVGTVFIFQFLFHDIRVWDDEGSLGFDNDWDKAKRDNDIGS